MEIKFTDSLRAILTFAREEALRTGHITIEPDHLILGILRHERNNAVTVLEDEGLQPRAIKEYIDLKFSTGQDIPYSQLENILLSESSRSILSLAVMEMRKDGAEAIAPTHLLLAILRANAGYGCAYILRNNSYDRYAGIIRANYSEARHNPGDFGRDTDSERAQGYGPGSGQGYGPGSGQGYGPESGQGTQEEGGAEQEADEHFLDDYGYDLTKAASEGKLDPVYGRDAQLERIMQILGRRRKNNPILVGDAGVGKSAIVEALARLKNVGREDITIYSDSMTAISWVRQKKCRTKLLLTPRTNELFLLVQRAENWLKENTFANPIIKWPTDQWGEIPADFGRK